MAEHLPYYGHEQGCQNSRIPWGPQPCPGCVALRAAYERGVKAARDAVMTWNESAFDLGIVARGDILAAIDGVKP